MVELQVVETLGNVLDQTKTTGIVLKSTPVKDRDALLQVLNDSGRVMGLMCYGAQPGGKSQKAALVQVGNLIEVELQKKSLGEVGNIKEVRLKWGPVKIRSDYLAYQLQCFTFELALLLALPQQLGQLSDQYSEGSGLYRVVSNALFYTDQAVSSGAFNAMSLSSLFLAKILFEEGLCPDLSSCSYCQSSLKTCSHGFSLNFEEGQFICSHCQEHPDGTRDHYRKHREVWSALNIAWRLKFKDWREFSQVTIETPKILLQFLSKQYNFTIDKIKTAKGLSLA